MKFESKDKRMEHEKAKLISDQHWDDPKLFNGELKGEQILLMTKSIDVLLNKPSSFNKIANKKVAYLCVTLANTEATKEQIERLVEILGLTAEEVAALTVATTNNVVVEQKQAPVENNAGASVVEQKQAPVEKNAGDAVVVEQKQTPVENNAGDAVVVEQKQTPVENNAGNAVVVEQKQTPVENNAGDAVVLEQKQTPVENNAGDAVVVEQKQTPVENNAGDAVVVEQKQTPVENNAGDAVVVEQKQAPVENNAGDAVVVEQKQTPVENNAGDAVVVEQKQAPVENNAGDAVVVEQKQTPVENNVGDAVVVEQKQAPVENNAGDAVVEQEQAPVENNAGDANDIDENQDNAERDQQLDTPSSAANEISGVDKSVDVVFGGSSDVVDSDNQNQDQQQQQQQETEKPQHPKPAKSDVDPELETVLSGVKFNQHLAFITCKIEEYSKRSGQLNKDAFAAAEILNESLNLAKFTFLNPKNTDSKQDKVKEFKRACSAAIIEAKETLDVHRGWKQVLADFLSLIVSVGTLGIANYVTKKGIFDFFPNQKTHATEILDDFTKDLNNVNDTGIVCN